MGIDWTNLFLGGLLIAVVMERWLTNGAITAARRSLESAASRIEELERALGELVDYLERRARACEGLRPEALDRPLYHRQAYRYAQDLARQALSDKG